MSELDVVANEMAGARRELDDAMAKAVVWLRCMAEEGDLVAATVVERIDAASDRMAIASIAAASTIQEEESRG